MNNQTFNEESVRNKLTLIIEGIADIDIIDFESSLFGTNYYLSPELVIYILLEISKIFGFDINDEFILTLGEYSYDDLANAIIKQVFKQ